MKNPQNGFSKICRGASLLTLSLVASAAHAQQPPVEADDGGEQIVVTARKRAESILDVPASITAFSNEKLGRIGANIASDLQNSVPNLQWTTRGDLNQQISIRGIGGDPRSIGIESGVGLYVDQVFMGRTTGYNPDLTNVSQIEILRGPQGTLFGKNTIGGVINITTKKPTDTVEGDVSASYGNYNAIALKGHVSGPIASNLFVGVSASSNYRKGWIENIFNGQRLQGLNRKGGRVQLRWLPTPDVEVNWSVDRTTNNNDYALSVPASPATGPAIPYATGNARKRVSMDQSNRSDLSSTGASQTIDVNLEGGFKLTSISSYRKSGILLYSDADALPIDTLHSGPFTDKSRALTQEIRLTSPSDKRLRFVGGGYYFNQNAKADRTLYIAGSVFRGYQTSSRINTRAYAAFGNMDFDITPQLTATGGLRYTKETKRGSNFQVGGSGALNYSFPNLDRSDQDVSWSGSLNYKPSREFSTYLTVSRGFKSGGFNVDPLTVTGLTVDRLTYAPETVINYELGAKGRLLDGKLTFGVAAFRGDYNNKQVSQIVPGANFIAVQITNAGKARVKGFELEATLRPDRFWTLDINGSLLDAKYTKFDNAASVGGQFISFTGNTLENAPKGSASADITRRQPLGSGYLVLGGTYRFTGSTYFQPDNNPLHRQKSYSLMDGRIGFETGDGRTQISFWGKNLTNKGYFLFSRVQGGVHQVLYGDPRMYGVAVSYRL